jgi:hypothetical protein
MEHDKMPRRRKDREARDQQRHERLGTNNPECHVCGERDPRVFFESHHIAGQRYDDINVLICTNCHAKLSDDQKDHPETTEAEPCIFEIVGRFLLGLADLLVYLIDKLRGFGNALIESAQQQAS